MRRRSGSWGGIARVTLAVGGWAAALFVTALLVPAFTKQWADRSKELEMKGTLVRTLGESTAGVVSNARFLGAATLPSATAWQRRCENVKPVSAGERDRCRELVHEEVLENARVSWETRTEWRRSAASLQAQVATYFPDRRDDWDAFAAAIEDFLRLPTNACGPRFEQEKRQLVRYAGHDPAGPSWAHLIYLTDAQCRTPNRGDAYFDAVDLLERGLDARRERLLGGLLDARAKGFSTTRGDLMRDIGWEPLVVVAIALAVAVLSLRAGGAREGR